MRQAIIWTNDYYLLTHICVTRPQWVNILRPIQNGRHIADDKCIFLNENDLIPIKISQKFVSKDPINNIQALLQIMAWHCQGAKPLSEPMMARLKMQIYIARSQWVKNNVYVWLHTFLVFAAGMNWDVWTISEHEQFSNDQHGLILHSKQIYIYRQRQVKRSLSAPYVTISWLKCLMLRWVNGNQAVQRAVLDASWVLEKEVNMEFVIADFVLYNEIQYTRCRCVESYMQLCDNTLRPRQKWTPFRRRHFQTHLHEWKC